MDAVTVPVRLITRVGSSGELLVIVIVPVFVPGVDVFIEMVCGFTPPPAASENDPPGAENPALATIEYESDAMPFAPKSVVFPPLLTFKT